MEEIYNTVVTIINEVCDIDESDINEETNIVEDLGIDSIDFLDVSYEIDQKYKIKLPVEAWMEEINTNQASLADYFVMKAFVKHIHDLASKNQAA